MRCRGARAGTTLMVAAVFLVGGRDTAVSGAGAASGPPATGVTAEPTSASAKTAGQRTAPATGLRTKRWSVRVRTAVWGFTQSGSFTYDPSTGAVRSRGHDCSGGWGVLHDVETRSCTDEAVGRSTIAYTATAEARFLKGSSHTIRSTVYVDARGRVVVKDPRREW